jgi:hypothetical protein
MSRIDGHTYSSVQARTRVLLDDEMMREILADVGAMRTALELELWASWILGQTWKQRVRQPLFSEVDWMLTVGAPMVSMIAEIGGARARKALTAISMLEPGALGNYAGAIALTLPGARTPTWMRDIADARLTSARQSAECEGFGVLLFDLHCRDRHELSIAVSIDGDGGGVVKWIQLLAPVPAHLEIAGGGAAPLGVGQRSPAMARVRQAIRRNDADTRAKVEPNFVDLRAFLLAKVTDGCRG